MRNTALLLLVYLLLPETVWAAKVPQATLAPRPDLPLIEIRGARQEGSSLAILISGAGGWAPLVRTLGQELAARDLAVVGVDAMRYFWQRRSPEEAAADLTLVLRHYMPAWHRNRVVLIGYSMGAEVLPFLFNRLPADLKRQTAAVVLIGPGTMASFEFHLLYLLGVGDDGGDYPVLPEILKLSAVTVLCVYGRDEEASACRQLPKGRGDLRPVELPGDHHFDSNYQALAETILRELRSLGH
jgi:type IV secretory pathway VirJ component